MIKNTNKYVGIVFLVVIVLAFLFFLIFNYLISILNPDLTAVLVIVFIFSVVFSLSVTIGLVVFAPIFSDTLATLRRMFRLESLSHPLLLKLSAEAPGTYHHSINVSTLAQKVAKGIGADSLLVRTAAYYHDIGKLSNPLFYIENQAGTEMPKSEDAKTIRKNADVVISHVEKGVKIAKEYKLPEEIINIIKEHHGTTRTLYFFRIAKEKGLKIKRTDFRYSGPIPQSKESAILMLADCTEATLRAYDNLNAKIIHEVVKNTIEERMADNQFKNCGLSENEYAKIKNLLESNLLSIYHQRIEYNNDQSENK